MLDTELALSWCVLCKRYFLHHSHQISLGVYEIFVLEYQQLKNETRYEMLSSSLLDPLSRVAMRPICANSIEEGCVWLSSFSMETSNLTGAVWPCDCRAGQMMTSSMLTNCLLHIWSLSLWHALCLSSTLWHSPWDANVWKEDASMMSWCSLVDGRLYKWSEGHAEHIFVGAEDHYCCICLFLLIWSVHPKSCSLCQLQHLGNREWWACNLGVAEITLSRSS